LKGVIALNFSADLERTATCAKTRLDLGDVFKLYVLFSVCFKEGLARASFEPVRIETINSIELKNPISRYRIFLARLGNGRAIDPKHGSQLGLSFQPGGCKNTL
jgi:hypothetical protein